MLFKEIIGQENLKTHLINSVKDYRIPHALLLWGNEGCGKLALALATAQYLQCENRQGDDSCGVCPSCRLMQNLTHPDLHFAFPITKEGSKTVCNDFMDSWRETIIESPYFSYKGWIDTISNEKQGLIYSNESEEILKKLSLKSYSNGYKIMIIWLAEKMHETCANKLLKLIEEPPQNTIFILISEQVDAIIPTILSRTQMIHVPVIEESALANVFGNKIAHIANGNYIKALEISKQEYSNSENLEIYRALMLCAFSKDLIALKNLTESISGKSREFIKNFLNYAQFITRECFISHLQNASLNYMEDSETAFADKFKRFLNVENIENIMELFNTASRDINQNVNTKIVLFDLGINLMTQIKK